MSSLYKNEYIVYKCISYNITSVGMH